VIWYNFPNLAPIIIIHNEFAVCLAPLIMRLRIVVSQTLARFANNEVTCGRRLKRWEWVTTATHTDPHEGKPVTDSGWMEGDGTDHVGHRRRRSRAPIRSSCCCLSEHVAVAWWLALQVWLRACGVVRRRRPSVILGGSEARRLAHAALPDGYAPRAMLVLTW
jgi:hypothetical protein